MGWMARLAGRRDDQALPLYTAIVGRARETHWYVEGAVPDSVDGRFDMIAAVLAFVLLRLEDDPAGAETNAWLAERFVADMDGQLREIGVGDVIVGKHIGRMMSMLGGRIGAYRDGVAAGDLNPAIVRNLYRGAASDPAALDHVAARLLAFRRALAVTPTQTLITGTLP